MKGYCPRPRKQSSEKYLVLTQVQEWWVHVPITTGKTHRALIHRALERVLRKVSPYSRKSVA